MSADSGDLVGHVFRNDSAVGRRILMDCVVGIPCALETVRFSEFDGPAAQWLGFADQPAGWKEIVAAEGPRVGSAIDDYPAEARTRYGMVAADRENLALLWREKPLLPAERGIFSVGRHFSSWGAGELLLVQNTGGVACPALYRFVEITSRGADIYPEFATCSDLVYPFMDNSAQGKPRVVVRMVDFIGPFGSDRERHKASRARVDFVFSDGQLTRDGKLVTPEISGGALR
ncbi:hypothetical protein ACIGHN_02345 [Acidovorax sp. NPDC077693]|uniref:hypothetical protein n=1 Tax=unclassified Acidovorax TaxID=2684926 RepID=UPI0037C5C136